MSPNVSSHDRIIRILAGLLIVVLGLYLGSWLGALGVGFLFTGGVSWCPIYEVFGISTLDVGQR
jgi:hypothetical protein